MAFVRSGLLLHRHLVAAQQGCSCCTSCQVVLPCGLPSARTTRGLPQLRPPSPIQLICQRWRCASCSSTTPPCVGCQITARNFVPFTCIVICPVATGTTAAALALKDKMGAAKRHTLQWCCQCRRRWAPRSRCRSRPMCASLVS